MPSTWEEDRGQFQLLVVEQVAESENPWFYGLLKVSLEILCDENLTKQENTRRSLLVKTTFVRRILAPTLLVACSWQED